MYHKINILFDRTDTVGKSQGSNNSKGWEKERTAMAPTTIRKKLPLNTPQSFRTQSKHKDLFSGVGGNSSKSTGGKSKGTKDRATEEDDHANMQLAKVALQNFGATIGDLYKGKYCCFAIGYSFLLATKPY
jgi:hypothetical protein